LAEPLILRPPLLVAFGAGFGAAFEESDDQPDKNERDDEYLDASARHGRSHRNWFFGLNNKLRKTNATSVISFIFSNITFENTRCMQAKP
jgi:hypothetical protein